MIDDSREKLINMIVFFLKKTKYCSKTKLFKLLYFSDFKHFQQTGKSISGLSYFTFSWGPVPKSLFDEFQNPPEDLEKYFYIPSKEELESDDDNELFELKTNQKFKDIYFTDREIEIMEETAFIYKEVRSTDISNISHDQELPWYRTKNEKGMQQEIDYNLALTNDSPSRDVIETLHEERKVLRKLLS